MRNFRQMTLLPQDNWIKKILPSALTVLYPVNYIFIFLDLRSRWTESRILMLANKLYRYLSSGPFARADNFSAALFLCYKKYKNLIN